jgi:hypothetical protein
LKQTKSASAYAVEFQTLAAVVSYDNNALCGVFFKGLSKAVKKSIIQQGRAKTFEALKDQAIYFDQHEHRMRVEDSKEGHIPNSRALPQETTRTQPSSPPSKPKNTTHDSQKRKHRFAISREEYQRRLDNHLCFECGEGGHSAEECRKKKGTKREYGANATTAKKRRTDSPKSPISTPASPYPPYQPNPFPTHHESQAPENWQSRIPKRSES